MSGADQRARNAVRVALRVFGHGDIAAAWLGNGNDAFSGDSPLLIAKTSQEGLERVLWLLDFVADIQSN